MNFNSECVVSDVFTINPLLAQKMLATSTGNRSIRPGYVSDLAQSMKRGEWKVTNQGIGFNSNGCLRDGHHRLNAVIESGATVQMLVTLGLDEDVYMAVDTGLKRSVFDTLGEEKKVVDVLTLGAKIVFSAMHNVTPTQVRTFIDTPFHVKAKEIYTSCTCNRRVTASAVIKLSAIVLMLEGFDNDYVKEQYRALNSLDFMKISPVGQAFLRQIDNGTAVARTKSEMLAKGYKIFDPDKASLSKLSVGVLEQEASFERAKSIILKNI